MDIVGQTTPRMYQVLRGQQKFENSDDETVALIIREIHETDLAERVARHFYDASRVDVPSKELSLRLADCLVQFDDQQKEKYRPLYDHLLACADMIVVRRTLSDHAKKYSLLHKASSLPRPKERKFKQRPPRQDPRRSRKRR